MNYCHNLSSKLKVRSSRQSDIFTWIVSLMLTMTGVQAKEISIGLYDNLSTLYLKANQNYQVIEDLDDKNFSNPRTILESRTEALIRSSPATANPLLIAAPPDLVTTSHLTEFSCISNSRPCLFTIKADKLTRTYRGKIIIKPYSNHFIVINRLDLEDYLKGVVPAEMPSSWPDEALKAQAVAARTYSLSMIGRRSTLGYDLKSSVEDQVYLGYNKEQNSSNAAIQATNGEFMIDQQGLLAEAYFSSSAGRYSASPEEGWGISPKSYLVPKKDWTQNPWKAEFKHDLLNDKLADLQLGSIEAITVINRSMEGRAVSVLISGSNGHHALLSGEEFRHQLGLRSTDFQIKSTDDKIRHPAKRSFASDVDTKKVGTMQSMCSAYEDNWCFRSKSIIISGYGFGHGIGLSQHGAKYLAQEGKSYQEILGHYYRGANLIQDY